MDERTNEQPGASSVLDGGSPGSNDGGAIGITGEPVDSATGLPIVSLGGDSGSGGSGEPVKRGRGRPRKDGSGKSGSGGGSGNRTSAKTDKLAVVQLGNVLAGIHLLLAKATGMPELELDGQEAQMLGDAMKTVAAEYDYIPDAKVIAWAGLIGTAASIYGPRVTAAYIRVSMAKAKKPKPEPVRAEAPRQGVATPATPPAVPDSALSDSIAANISGVGGLH